MDTSAIVALIGVDRDVPRKSASGLELTLDEGLAFATSTVSRIPIGLRSLPRCPMKDSHGFVQAFAYRESLFELPVADIDIAARWYASNFGFVEISRQESPAKSVLMERDSVRIGFAENGGDSSQDGAAVLVNGIDSIRMEFESNGVRVGDLKSEERDGDEYQVFLVVAPDGLCYYFHEKLSRQ